MAIKKATTQLADIEYEIQPAISIKDYTNTCYKEYSLYVLQQRAIPNYIDGFKVVQRKLICAALDLARNKKVKVAELGSSLSSCVSKDTEIIINGACTTIGEYYNVWSENDVILAFSEESLEQKEASVLNVTCKPPKELFILELEDGTTLEITSEHLVMTKSRSWQKVSDLTTDDEVVAFN